MKSHFLFKITPDERMTFQVELFMRALEQFGNLDDYKCTVLIPAGCSWWVSGKRSEFIRKRADIQLYHNILELEPSWALGLRWGIKTDADVCVLVDADTLICGDFNSVIETCYEEQKVCGVIAYKSPFKNDYEENWKGLYDLMGVSNNLEYEHWFDGGKCPFYLNNGIIAVPTSLMHEVYPHLVEWVIKVNYAKDIMDYPRRGQISLTLALEAANVPKCDLPLINNYPVKLPMFKESVYDVEDAIFLHYFIFNKRVDSWSGIDKLINRFSGKRRMRPSLKKFIRIIRGLRDAACK